MRPFQENETRSGFAHEIMSELQEIKQKTIQGWRNSLPARPHSLAVNHH